MRYCSENASPVEQSLKQPFISRCTNTTSLPEDESIDFLIINLSISKGISFIATSMDFIGV